MRLSIFAETLAMVNARDPETGAILNRFLIDCLQGVVPDWESMEKLAPSLLHDCKAFFENGSIKHYGHRFFDTGRYADILDCYGVKKKPTLQLAIAQFFGYGLLTTQSEHLYLDNQGQSYPKLAVRKFTLTCVMVFLSLGLYVMTKIDLAFYLYMLVSLFAVLSGMRFLYATHLRMPVPDFGFNLADQECLDQRVVNSLNRLCRMDKFIYQKDIEKLQVELDNEIYCLHDDLFELKFMPQPIDAQQQKQHFLDMNMRLSTCAQTRKALQGLWASAEKPRFKLLKPRMFRNESC